MDRGRVPAEDRERDGLTVTEFVHRARCGRITGWDDGKFCG